MAGERQPEQIGQGGQGLGLGMALSALTAIQLLLSFGIQWYTIARLGAGPETDALYAGATLLQLFLVAVMDPLSSVLVPLLSGRTEADRRGSARPLCLGMTTLAGLLVLIIAAAAPLLVPLLVPGFSAHTRALTVELMRIQVMGLIGAAAFTVLAALSHARNRFLWPAGALVVCSLVGWGLLSLGLSRVGVRLAAWVQVFLWCGPALLLLKGLGAGPSRSLFLDRPLWRELWDRLRPLLFSAAYVRTGFVVDRFLTSFLAAGSLVMFDLAWRVLAAIVRIFNQGVVTTVVPTLSALAGCGAWREFAQLCRARLWWMGAAGLAALLTLLAVVTLAQTLDLWSETLATFRALLLAGSGVLLFGGINHLLVNAFYADGESALPARLEILTTTAGLALKGMGVLAGGLTGLAAAITLQYALSCVLLGGALARRVTARIRTSPFPPAAGMLVAESSRPL
ncbi:MAG: hypothetical protein GDA68_11485 [Nitrospira sp. CR2.1]|nr:hypothetical protein [Nitrospira sp. CR2.1]